MARPARRLLPWASVAFLVLLATGAGIASAVTAPAPSTTTTTFVPTGAPCLAAPGTPTLTLNDKFPRPTITVPVGASFTVMVPPWHWGEATDVTIVHPAVLEQQCSVLLSNGGRRVVVLAKSPGETYVGATVMPASDLAMPAWGGEVTVVP